VDRKGSQRLKFVGVELRNSSGSVVPHVQSGESATIALAYRSGTGGELDDVFVSIGVHGKFDENLFDLSTVLQGFTFERIPESGTFICHIPRLPLQPGTYPFNVYCEVAGDLADWVQNAGHIEVEPGDFYGSGKLSHPDQGPFLVDHSWDIAPDDQNVRLSPQAGDLIPTEVL
jgi:lipopolysaccharide transport system ATP-binding protein